MNIPFDQIYNHLAGSVDDDIIIYRYSPPGSKKLSDLSQLEDRERTYQQSHDSIALIFHDQEPLDTSENDRDQLRAWYAQNFAPLVWHTDNSDLWQYLRPQGLAAVTRAVNIADRNILVHSELNSAEVEHYRDLGLEPVYWWSHAVIARDWYRYAEHDWRLQHRDTRHLFLIYNRAWGGSREYRLTFASMLLDQNLHLDTRITFNACDSGQHYLDHAFRNSDFWCRRDLDQLPQNTASSASSADYSVTDYQQCWWEVVQETLFDDARIHLTEKILRPIACGTPFLLLAPAGSLAYLRELGFETFGDVIDESYDTITDPVDRMRAVIQEMLRIRSWSSDQREKIQADLASRIQHNKRWFFSREFLQQRLDEWNQNYQQARSVCEAHRQGHAWTYCRQLLARDPQHRDLITRHNPRVPLNDIMQVLRLCHDRRRAG